MIRTITISAACLTMLGAASCKKNKDTKKPTPIDTPVYVDYTALKPGNYWIYQEYRLDSANGAGTEQGVFDSCYVEKDTTINGKVYHKYLEAEYASPNHNIFFFRDSLSYTVDQGGLIHFSSADFTNVFRRFDFGPNAATPDTLHITEQMGFKDSVITVGAGTFNTSTFRRIYHFPAGYAFGATRDYDYTYSPNVGMVKETIAFYSASPQVYERRLLRYHVQ